MTLTPEELDRIVRGTKLVAVMFVCPSCDRAHEPKDLGTSFQCRSCENGMVTTDRPRCPDCTGVRPLPDDPLWFPKP